MLVTFMILCYKCFPNLKAGLTGSFQQSKKALFPFMPFNVFFSLFFMQILTVYDILKDDKKIEILCPDINFEAVNFQQLLILELEAYSLSR